MRRFYLTLVAMAFLAANVTFGGEYRLSNGDIIRGDLSAANEDGATFRRDIGGFTPWIPWGKMTQETLKEVAKDPRATKFAEPFIEVPLEVRRKERAKRREITLKPVERPERLAKKPGLIAAFASPVGYALLGALFLANLFAAYEIAAFRHRPPALVMGVSAVLPVLGPLIFLSMPAPVGAEGEEYPAHEVADVAHGSSSPLAAVPGVGSGGLSLAAGEKQNVPSGGAMEQATYKRGDTTFNRRFFETKFPGFFRVVPSEAEKDLVLVVKTPRAEYVGKRISRISSNEMHIQVLRGGTEVSVPFGEMVEVQVRHKDSKA